MKVFLDTVGCRLNQAEIERMAGQFRLAGHEIVATAGEADLALVNTCTVTSRAAADSRGKIRRISRKGVKEIVATGCWVTQHPQKARELVSKLRVVNNSRKDTLVSGVLELPENTFDLEPIIREPLPGERRRTRAFVKVQDGCDNHCTFCVTTLARGASRSRPLVEVVAEVQAALEGGGKEVVLTGVHLGSWGREFNSRLRDLVAALLADTDVPRLRLSSLEPWDLDEDFFTLWEDRRLCRHLHLPLQSGCTATLKRMARKNAPASFRNLVAAARQIIPEVALTTDVIAGFPGETDQEFAESLAFIKEMDFAGGHAFPYSPRPGTAAARLGCQTNPKVRKERSALLRKVFEEGARAYRQRFIGRRMSVLWETATALNGRGWKMEGLTGNYLRVTANAARSLWNEISSVELRSGNEKGLSGVLSNQDP